MLGGKGGSVDGQSSLDKAVGVHPLPDDGYKNAVLIPGPGIDGKVTDYFILISTEQAPSTCSDNISDGGIFHI